MSFFAEPAFFVLLIPLVLLSVVLGLSERRIAPVGMLASLGMLFLLFSHDMASGIYFVAYVVLSLLLGTLVLHAFRRADETGDEASAITLYRVCLGLQIAPLAIYKVGVVFMPSFLGFMGISYITFKAVQVLIEIRDGLIRELSLFDYLYFLCFFPTFTSGPILRSRAFVQDIRTPPSRDEYLSLLYRGLGWFILGAVYKFVGSPLAQWFMWFVPEELGPGPLAPCVRVLGYGLDLFFDFAGYSHMAMGLGFVLGVNVPCNFRSPFVALDIKEFWDRWHISLSTWLRDFVFMRFTQFAVARKLFKSRITTACVGFMVNMVLMGLWHGITPDYFVYGVYHGLGLAACHYLQKKWKFYKAHKNDTWFKAIEWVVCMAFVFFGFALFGGYVVSPALGLA